jgi:cephalosporin hydroxylase
VDLSHVIGRLPNAFEGHLSPQQADFLYAFVRFIQPEVVVETGFGVGHSACTIMEAQKSVGIEPFVVSVDICEDRQTKLAAEIVGEAYPRHVLVDGDSKEVLRSAVHSVLREREGLALKLALIDGAHDEDTVRSDLITFHSFLALGGYMWLDDFEKVVPNSGVNAAGREFAHKWRNAIRFRSIGNRGIMLYQKAF